MPCSRHTHIQEDVPAGTGHGDPHTYVHVRLALSHLNGYCPAWLRLAQIQCLALSRLEQLPGAPLRSLPDDDMEYIFLYRQRLLLEKSANKQNRRRKKK